MERDTKIQDFTSEDISLVIQTYANKKVFLHVAKELGITTHKVKSVLTRNGLYSPPIPKVNNKDEKPDPYGRVKRKCWCSACNKFHIKRVNYLGTKEFPPYLCDSCKGCKHTPHSVLGTYSAGAGN